MDRPEQIETLPLQKVNPDTNLMVRDVATVQTGTAPGQIDRSSMQRYLSIIANVEGEDLGRAARRIRQAIADAGDPPRGVRVLVRGQVAPMTEMFQSLVVGLALSVVVILILLDRLLPVAALGLISIGAVPGVVCGVAMILLADRHDAEHRVVHGLDHVRRRLGLQLGDADDVHGRLLAVGHDARSRPP